MSDVVFDPQFFQKLSELISNLSQSIKKNVWWGVIFFLILIGAVIIQQILFVLLGQQQVLF